MAIMSVEEWRKKKEEEKKQGTSKSSASTSSKESSSTSTGSTSSGIMSASEWKAQRDNKKSTSSVEGWAQSSNSLLSEVQKYYSNWRSKDDEKHTSYQDRASSLLAQADSWRKQYTGNSDAISYIDSVVDALSNAKNYSYSSQKYYSQWETADDYGKFLQDQKDYEDKKSYDLIAGQKEVEGLEGVIKEVQDIERQLNAYKVAESRSNSAYVANKTAELNSRLAQITEQYGGVQGLETLVNQKKQYLNQAKHIQEGITLSGVINNDDFKANSGYSSTKSESGWDKMTSQFGMGYDDLTYEYINGEESGMRQEIRNKAATWGADSEKFSVYDHMTADQIATYNYYYAKDGKKAAEKYLNSIQETLNYQAASERFGKMEGNTALEMLFGIEAGLDQFKSGMKNFFNTEDDYIAQTATQMASGMVREDLEDDGFKLPDWIGGASIGQVGYDAITTTANMAPSILTSIAMNMILPGSGEVVGTGMMGMSAAGGAYQEALNKGFDKDQARGYSTLVGASEAVLGYLLGGVSKLGGKLSNKAIAGFLSKVDNAFLRTAGQIGGNMLSEFTEEYLQEVLTPVFSNLMLGTDEEINLFSAEALYSGLLGALTAGIMEGPTTIAGEVNAYTKGKALKAADISAERLAELGQTFSADTVAHQLAGRVDEKTGAYTMGRLFNEIGATLSEQNVTEITEALVAKGMDEATAKKNAEALAYVVEGGQLTDRQIAVIEANEILAEVARTTLIDANTTWNQRSKSYNEMLKSLADEMTAPKATKASPAQQTQENAPVADTVDAQNENGSESLSEAVDTSPAKVQTISAIEKGQTTVKLEDGTEVDVKKADLSVEDGVRIETIAQMEGITATDANFVLNTLRTSTGASAQMDSLGAREVWKYGYYGFSQEHMTTHGVFANSLTESQRNAIYETARKARQQQVDNKNATVAKKNATTEKSSATGKVHFDGDRSTLTERQSASLTAMEKIASTLGVQIYVFESKLNERGHRVGANGWYDPKDSSIHIDLHAGANGEGTMLFTLAHELVHHIRKWSPAKFKTLADFLMQEYGKKGVNVNALVRQQMRKAKANGRTISYDTAYEEVVADSMEMMLADGNVMKRLEKLKAQDKDLWYQIKKFIDDLATKIRNIYKGLKPDSVEGRYVADMGKAVYRLQEMFAEALVEASENYQSSLTPGEEGTIVNENGDPVAHATADGTIQLSLRTYNEEGRAEFRKYLKKCVKNKRLTKAEMQEMLDGIEDIYMTCKEFKDQYAPFSSWSDAAVVRDTYGKPVFSVVTPNGDYKMNLDFSLVCKKRRTLDAVFNEMSKRGIIDNFELGQKSVVKINEIIRKYGLETACALCFVDAKRFRQASMADQFTKLYNELVLSLVPEEQRSSIDHFNFSGYETIKKVEGGIDTWDDSKLDFSHLDEVMKNYGDGTVEYKAANYIKANAEGRKLLLRGDFMSSKGFDAVKTQNQDILKLYNSKKGTGGPKAAFGDVQYMNEIIQKAQWWTPEKAYAVGGVRVQSFSDYVPRMVFDYVQMIYDLAATKLPAHAYTKEALFVKQFGLTGIKINMSLIPAVVEGGIAPGLDANGNYVWAGESFDFETAKEIQNAEGYSENCGTICVGVSYDHIVKLLSDPDIRMVIPYHKSGLNPIVAHMNKIAEFTDYTSLKTNKGGCQSTIDKNGSKVEVDFNFNEVLRETGDPKATVRQYLNWCAENEYTPRFAEFAWHENYYKLIEDFTLYDKDGKYVPQREVRPVFPKETDAFGSMRELIKSGLEEDAIIEGKKESSLSSIVDEIQNTLPRTEAEISEEQVEQADRDLEAVMLSDRDNAPTFYSQMAKVIEGVKQEKLGAASVVSMLRGKGVKAEEIEWSGIEEWLAGKKSVTRAELLEFIAGSMLQLEEETLSDDEMPYSQEHLDQIANYEAERDIIVENLKSEWKRIVGTDIPISYFGAGLDSAVVQKLLEVNSTKKGETEVGYKYKAARAALQRCIEYSDHYFGFDNERQAFREAVRDPKDFLKSYEMTSFEEGVFRDFIKAKEAYSKVEAIPMQDQKALKAIAESAERFNRRIGKVKSEHYAEAAKHKTKWGQYKIKGGTNYRELLFKIPGSSYHNSSMATHWGDRDGVLAHARIQDLNTFLGKMLFIEEIQSDWHNAGHKGGYLTKEDSALDGEAISKKLTEMEREMDRYLQSDEAHDLVASFMHYYDIDDEYRAIGRLLTTTEYDFVRLGRTAFPESVVNSNAYNSLRDYLAQREKMLDEADRIYDITKDKAPDAPFKDTYHEFVLKRLLREAAEQGYDSIGWTTAYVQMERWNRSRKTNAEMGIEDAKNPNAIAFEEGYRIEYDQDIPKFLNKYGKKWGTKVGKTELDNGTEVWSMAITDEMKDSVLTEGQPLYSDRDFPSNAEEIAKDYFGTTQKWSETGWLLQDGTQLDFSGRHWERDPENEIDLGESYYSGKRNMEHYEIAEAFPDLREFSSMEYRGEHLDRFMNRGNIRIVGKGIVAIEKMPTEAQFEKLRSYFRENIDRGIVVGIGRSGLNFDAGTNPSIIIEGIRDYFAHNRRNQSEVMRFHTMFSDRDTESVSNRSLLANAFEGVAQNDIEKQKIKEYKGKIDLINAEERKLTELNQKIKDLSFAKGPKDTKAIRDLQFEAKQTANRINTFDKQLLRLEASKPLQDVLAREKKTAYQRAEKKGKEALEAYREKTMKTQRELIDRWKDSRKKGIESRHKTAMRHKIKDVVNELNQYLLRGTKDRHVPIELQKAVAEALDAVNMDTVGADERIAKLQAELMKAKTPEEIQEISRKIDHIREMGDKMNGRLKKLKDAYDQFVNSDDPMIANSHDEVISDKLQAVIESVGDTPLKDMTLTQLEDVYDMYRMVLTTIRNANKAFKAKKSESISVIANQVMTEVEKVGGKKKQSLAMFNGVKSFGWNNLKPVYAFEHIGSDHFTEVFNNVRAGEDVWALDVTEAREFYLDKSKKHNYDSWDFKKRYTFTSTSGMDFSLDLEQIMSLYAYSKRDQAADHLKKGGIVFDESTKILKKTKLGISLEFNPTEATAYNISDAVLADIISKLSDEQKGFVDEMQDYLSTVMGAKGNEVSLEMYGVKLFKEKFYFPLKSAQQFMAKAKEQQKGEVKIKNSGFSKETVQKASNPIVLTPFMNVWANHVNEMSMYHAFVLPMEDFYRVYNYKTPTSDTMATESVEMFIQNAYGKGATAYIDQLLKDLNGGARTDHTTGIINKMMGLFKKGSVFASLSVVVQQPSAIARAVALVDTKYFIGPKVDHKRHKALWDEVKQYAPVAIIKEMGYFDTNMGKSTQDFILGKEYSGFKEKMKALVTDSNFRDEALSKAPALADELAWCSIWEAVKRETKAKYPGLDVKGEPFLKLAGSRFTEVIVKTQVYDSVLSRSGLMRSKDTGMKMATAFMAEPTTSINMITDALLQGKRGNRKYARSAIGAVIASQILNSILVSFVYAGRDDDEDKTYAEKYIGTLTGEVLDSLNPLTYIPFIKDIISIVQGYDVERSDMAVISDLWKAYENLGKDYISPYRKVEGFAGSVAQIFGLPVKNIMRDARGIYQTIDSFVNGQQTTKAGIGYAVKGAITGKDVSDQNQLYEAIISGDQAQIARVKGRYEDQTAINNAIRKALRENDPRIHEAAVAWNANDLDEYMRIAKQIIAEKHFAQDDVVSAIRSEANALAPDDGTSSTSKAKGLFTAEKFAEAIAQGDQATANAIKSDIIQTAQKNGKTEEEAEKSFVSSAKSELKEMFLAGEISEDEVINALTTYCGAEENDALADVQYWAFKQDYPDVYADDAWFDKYYKEIADSGISIDMYMEYRNDVKDITGEGKKERRMAVINSLPISKAQKDALYFAEGWTASTLNEAPWH